MTYNVLFIGCGNIALRNFQGLLSSQLNFNFFLFDISQNNFKKFQTYFLNNNFNNSKLFFSNKLNFNVKKIHLLLHCTTADVRLKYCKYICKKYSCRYIILEKILANDLTSLKRIQKLFKYKRNVYVNTPRRSMNFYKKLKNKINLKTLLGFEVNGGNWGLACNSIHFIDLVSWILGLDNYIIESYKLGRWKRSKRKNFYDINGQIKINFEKYYLKLLSYPKNGNMNVIIKFKSKKILINETEMRLETNNTIKEAKIDLQSELILSHMKNIANNKQLDLPNLNFSVNHHIKYISFFINVWNMKNKQSIKFAPIT